MILGPPQRPVGADHLTIVSTMPSWSQASAAGTQEWPHYFLNMQAGAPARLVHISHNAATQRQRTFVLFKH